MGRRPRATWPGKERQEDQQPRSKTEVSAWLQDRLDTLNRASVGGWFDEVLRQARTMKNADWWKLVYERGAELFGEDFKGILLRAEEGGAFDAAFETFVDDVQVRMTLSEARRRYHATVGEIVEGLLGRPVDGETFAKGFRAYYGWSPGAAERRKEVGAPVRGVP